MGDFKSLDEIAEEMELERQKPWRPPQNAAEANAETARLRRLAREQQPAQEQPQEAPQETPVGFPHADAKLLSKANPVPAAAEAVAEQPAQSNGNGSQKPDWNTTGYPPIAAHCGVTRRHIARIMCGTRKPSLAVLRSMASFFGIRMDELDSKLEAIRNTPAH